MDLNGQSKINTILFLKWMQGEVASSKNKSKLFEVKTNKAIPCILVVIFGLLFQVFKSQRKTT